MLYQAMQEQYRLLFWMDELFPIIFQTSQGGAFAVPQKIAVDVGHLSRDVDLVAVEVVGLLSVFAFFGCPVVDLCQGFVCTSPALHQDWKFHAGYGLLPYCRRPVIFILSSLKAGKGLN